MTQPLLSVQCYYCLLLCWYGLEGITWVWHNHYCVSGVITVCYCADMVCKVSPGCDTTIALCPVLLLCVTVLIWYVMYHQGVTQPLLCVQCYYCVLLCWYGMYGFTWVWYNHYCVSSVITVLLCWYGMYGFTWVWYNHYCVSSVITVLLCHYGMEGITRVWHNHYCLVGTSGHLKALGLLWVCTNLSGQMRTICAQ